MMKDLMLSQFSHYKRVKKHFEKEMNINYWTKNTVKSELK
jgi:hypothetical protein